jgi:DoxX-like family
MTTVAAILSVLLAGAVAFSAVRKLSHDPQVVQTYIRVGVPEERLDYLAIILLAGATGLLLGLFWSPVGLAAAIGLSVYFLLAIASHVRADDLEHAPAPVAIELVAVAVLVLQLARL